MTAKSLPKEAVCPCMLGFNDLAGVHFPEIRVEHDRAWALAVEQLVDADVSPLWKSEGRDVAKGEVGFGVVLADIPAALSDSKVKRGGHRRVVALVERAHVVAECGNSEPCHKKWIFRVLLRVQAVASGEFGELA